MNGIQYRGETLKLRNKMLRRLLTVWPVLNPERLDQTFQKWLVAVGVAVGVGRQEAADLAAQYLLAARVSVLGPPPLQVERFATSMRVTGPVAVKLAMGRGIAAAAESGFVQSSQAAVRLALEAGRQTVMASAVADPRCEGWERITAGGCDFCQMLADRGAVYSEESADFLTHDGCSCAAGVVLA